MKWKEIQIQTDNEAVEAIANIFADHKGCGVVIEDASELSKERIDKFGEIYQLSKSDYPKNGVVLKSYFSMEDFTDERFSTLTTRINELTNFGLALGENIITITEVDDKDWQSAWKKFFHPTKITNSLTVVPSWETYTKKSESEKIITLDSGMAFGTGLHVTTQLAMQTVEKHMKQGATVIDVGTGSGILAIGAALIGAKKVLATDIDPTAIKVANENILANKVDKIVTTLESSLLAEIFQTVDLIIANIVADIIQTMAYDVTRLLKKNGVFIASGIIDTKKEQVIKTFTTAELLVEEIYERDGWVALVVRARA